MLGRDQIIELLEELGRELEEVGARGELFLVGGAAMALAYNTRRATRDLDGVFEPKAIVYAAAARVAERHGLPADWLNDGVNGFLHGDDPNATVLFDSPGLRVRVASPRYLFVMKAAAARIERDSDDLRELYRLSGFASVGEALDHIDLVHPFPLQPKVQYLLEEMLGGG